MKSKFMTPLFLLSCLVVSCGNENNEENKEDKPGETIPAIQFSIKNFDFIVDSVKDHEEDQTLNTSKDVESTTYTFNLEITSEFQDFELKKVSIENFELDNLDTLVEDKPNDKILSVKINETKKSSREGDKETKEITTDSNLKGIENDEKISQIKNQLSDNVFKEQEVPLILNSFTYEANGKLNTRVIKCISNLQINDEVHGNPIDPNENLPINPEKPAQYFINVEETEGVKITPQKIKGLLNEKIKIKAELSNLNWDIINILHNGKEIPLSPVDPNNSNCMFYEGFIKLEEENLITAEMLYTNPCASYDTYDLLVRNNNTFAFEGKVPFVHLFNKDTEGNITAENKKMPGKKMVKTTTPNVYGMMLKPIKYDYVEVFLVGQDVIKTNTLNLADKKDNEKVIEITYNQETKEYSIGFTDAVVY